jgi:hypothetical protein
MAGAHGAPVSSDKKKAFLISVFSLVLAIVHVFAQSYQTSYIATQVEMSNTWSFFQAKTIRQTVLKTAEEEMGVVANPKDAKVQTQLEEWRKNVDRYESEPSTGQGRKELAEKAKQLEKDRDRYLRVYHTLEMSAAMLELAILLESASIIVSVFFLGVAAPLVGVLGLGFALYGWLIGLGLV